MKKWLLAVLLMGMVSSAWSGVVDATVTGIGTGSLDGNSFSDESFEWTIQYDSADFYSYETHHKIDSADFSLNQISIQGQPTANITSSINMFVRDDRENMLCWGFQKPNDFFDVIDNEMPMWDGVSAYSATGDYDDSWFPSFSLETDRGTLSLDPSGVTDFTAVPEPAITGILAGGGLLIALYRRFFR